MKTYAPLISLLPFVSGNPVGSLGARGSIGDTLFCKLNWVVIEALHKDSAATPFCSSFLSLPPSATTTVTVTPSSVYTSVTITATGLPETVSAIVTQTATTGVTVTGVVYETETVTTTVTSPVSLTCLTTGYNATAATATAAAAVQRRGEDIIHKPVCIPPKWSAPYISKACSCLDLPDSTATVTQTLPAGTATSTYDQTITPTITNTITSIASTATSTISTAVTSTTTTTTTVTAAPTALVPSGARYRKYTHPYQAVTPPIVFSASYFKTASPDFTGILENLSFASPDFPSSDVTLALADRPGAPFDASRAAVLLQGFFRARAAGTYVLGTSSRGIDNWGYLWVGDVAYAAWGDGSEAFAATGPALTGPETLWNVSVALGAGDAVPVTWLWANGGGPSQSYFTVTAPDGSTTADTTGYFVPACGDGVFP